MSSEGGTGLPAVSLGYLCTQGTCLYWVVLVRDWTWFVSLCYACAAGDSAF